MLGEKGYQVLFLIGYYSIFFSENYFVLGIYMHIILLLELEIIHIIHIMFTFHFHCASCNVVNRFNNTFSKFQA